MKLITFIEQKKEEIASEWIKFVNKLIGPADDLSHKEVKDHIFEILEWIEEDMKTSQSESEQKRKSRGLNDSPQKSNQPAKKHGIQRVDAGFDIVHLSSEFRALRASVLRLWENEADPDEVSENHQEIVRFNEAVDEMWMKSMTHYDRKMDESKNWFLGILGHDLRNPLSAISSVQQILSTSENLSDEEKYLVARVGGSVQRMKELITNLLDLTNLRLGTGISIDKTSCDLTEQCDKIIQEFKIAYPDADIRLHSSGPIHGEWDRIRIEQVISNLIANALRYGTPGGPVTVSVAAENSSVSLSVHNEGDPIPENRKEMIFEGLFNAPENKNSNKQSSYGIGLYVVNEITKAHDGNIELRSDEEHGTTFTVKLPRH